jgi:hypothetical protein
MVASGSGAHQLNVINTFHLISNVHYTESRRERESVVIVVVVVVAVSTDQTPRLVHIE